MRLAGILVVWWEQQHRIIISIGILKRPTWKGPCGSLSPASVQQAQQGIEPPTSLDLQSWKGTLRPSSPALDEVGKEHRFLSSDGNCLSAVGYAFGGGC